MKDLTSVFAPAADLARAPPSAAAARKAHKAPVAAAEAGLAPAAAAPRVDTRPVRDIIHERVLAAAADADGEDPFYVGDLGELVRQHGQWRRLLPRVEPFYGACPTLAALGTGFDCASKAEIEMALDSGVDASRIIYANPCKQASHIRHAAMRGVRVMTFDNADELYKVKDVMPDAKMVLRILTDDSRSICRFGVKFGASLASVPALLRTAKEIGIDVVGISFHVGSGCFDAAAFGDAVMRARQAFDIGLALGFDFKLLDIGGGFPGRSAEGLQFETIANVLRPAIDEHFPDDVRVIAEPGRYFASSVFTLAVNIVARRVVANVEPAPASPSSPTTSHAALDANGNTTAPLADAPSFMYYINDGMYGSFNCLTFDHAVVKAMPLLRDGHFCDESDPAAEHLYACSIWGPTCDSIDCIGRDLMLPQMKIGDWLYFANMGAYTMAAASPFNGFKKSAIQYTNTAL
ncbi:Ornithine decarboxylase [Polyrhizophydium stewartii]|uniref:Ornithine decarboxylase n=1 Tax=Polyrhizophydium stewartii TaxID=2732419 RepID=A0ABR4NCQ9_9FUNG